MHESLNQRVVGKRSGLKRGIGAIFCVFFIQITLYHFCLSVLILLFRAFITDLIVTIRNNDTTPKPLIDQGFTAI
ncbi:MAG: hypothetical protein ACJA1U_001109 [Bermanella sp.]